MKKKIMLEKRIEKLVKKFRFFPDGMWYIVRDGSVRCYKGNINQNIIKENIQIGDVVVTCPIGTMLYIECD